MNTGTFAPSRVPVTYSSGGTTTFALLPANGTTAEGPANATVSYLAKVWSAGATETATIAIYDAPPGTSVSGLTPVYGPAVPSMTPVDLQIPLTSGGFQVVASAALAENSAVYVSYWA
jgi:hypothetical protein